ncbi:hypothetical protein C8J57DRAFT_1216094 [Mycena rebaudengoi]|nr:hypothetical protein C8J57DRAFT_1216094 [Mycena rebaudengoi]
MTVNSGMAAESQASQILRNALQPGSQEEDSIHNSIPVDDSGADSPSSSSYPHSAPHYHYHGLAATQTQSQQYDDESSVNEGSQKENVNASREALSSGNQIQGPPNAVSLIHNPGKSALSENPCHSPTKVVSNAKTVSFESPKAVATPIKLPEARAAGRPLSRHPPTPKRELSQDSFAGDLPVTAEAFIASTKKLNIPVEELARAASAEESPRPSRSGMYAYTSPSRPAGREPTPLGNILVASTPSNSDSSQSQSQPEPHIPPNEAQYQEETQSQEESQDNYLNARQPEDDGTVVIPGSQGSTHYESSPTSSYEHMMFPGNTPALEPTQTLEATQLVDPPSQSMEATQLVEDDRTQTIIQSDTDDELDDTGADAMSHATNHTKKSLLDSLDPRKRERYARYAAPNTRVDGISSVANATVDSSDTGALALEETQPALEQEPLALPKRTFPTTTRRNQLPASRVRPVVDDRTEIIPDSEPPREGSAPPVSPIKPPITSPLNARRRAASSDTETEAEVIPDSMMVDEEDGEEVRGLLSAKDSIRREEEEEEEEEEDGDQADDDGEEEEVPLAMSRRGGRADVKGKGKAVERDPPPVKPKRDLVTEAPPVKAKRNQKAPARKAPTKRNARNRSREIPSSVPHQDFPEAKRTAAKKPRAASSRKPAPTTRVTRRNGAMSAGAYNEESSDDELLMPKSERDEEAGLAHDEYVDVAVGVAGPSSRKRKRAIKAESPPVQRGKGGKAVSRAPGRQAKRPRAEATRVFALWRKDGHFYSGAVHSYSHTTQRYTVNFDDGNHDDTIKLDQMRSCVLNIGDAVLFGMSKRIALVTDFSEEDDDVVVTIDGKSSTVPISDLRIAGRTITHSWADRTLDADSIVSIIPPSTALVSPSPSLRASIASTPSARRSSNLFSGVGFFIALSSGVKDRDAEKSALATCIRNNGGVVIDSWDEIVSIKGKTTNNKNWVLKPSDASLVRHGLQRLFCLADDANTASKYLLSMAWVVPCIGVEYVTDTVRAGEEKEWMLYLLPSGYSDHLGFRLTQRVNADWGNSPVDADMLNNPLACNLFQGLNILCVGPDLVLVPGQAQNESTINIPNIVLAMGAGSVEAVRHVSHALSTKYDYVVTKDENITIPASKGRRVSWNWVKDALISGRLPPIII